MNRSLREVALLGTDRKKLDISTLPANIVNRLSPGSDPPTTILESIAYSSFYYEFGASGGLKLGPIDRSIITEDQPYCAKDTCDLVIEIIENGKLNKSRMMLELLPVILERDEIIRPEYVIPIIKSGNSLNRGVRSLIQKVIGNRGRKVLSFFPNLKYTHTQGQKLIWKEGRAKDRQQYFLKLRSEEPERAIDLLEKDWNQEGVRDKLSFLKIISLTYNEPDDVFVKKIFEADYKDRPVKKKLDRSCKQIVISLLCRSGHHELTDHIKAALSKYVVEGKSGKLLGRLTGQRIKRLELPRAQDEFWNGSNMSILLGLEEKNLNIKLFDYDALYWLSGMIEILPFRIWCELLEKDHADTVNYFLKDETFIVTISGVEKSALWQGVIDHVARTRDKSLVSIFSKSMYDKDTHVLIPMMSQSEFETYMTNNKLLIFTDLLAMREDAGDKEWSEHFTKNVISAFLTLMKKGSNYIGEHQGNLIARYFNPKALDHLRKISAFNNQEMWHNHWRSNLLEPIEQMIRLRQKINQLKSA